MEENDNAGALQTSGQNLPDKANATPETGWSEIMKAAYPSLDCILSNLTKQRENDLKAQTDIHMITTSAETQRHAEETKAQIQRHSAETDAKVKLDHENGTTDRHSITWTSIKDVMAMGVLVVMAAFGIYLISTGSQTLQNTGVSLITASLIFFSQQTSKGRKDK